MKSKILNKIKKDCIQLEKRGELTEFGYGQLVLIKIIEKGRRKNESC